MRQREQRKQQIRNLLTARELLTIFALAVSAGITYHLWEAANQTEERTLRSAFDFRARESTDRIQQRIRVYEQVLRATVGLFDAVKTVTRQGFRTYAQALRLDENYPGIQGIGFAIVVPATEKKRHVAEIRREGFPDYRISPGGKRNFYTSVIYLEPFLGRNLRAFGYDMYAEPNRRAAMALARDTGAAAATAPVTLVQESGSEVQSGFLMYLPVYRPDAPHRTVAERRQNLLGWVYAPFRMDDFMRGLQERQAALLDIEIYDGGTMARAARIYDANPAQNALDSGPGSRVTKHIAVANRIWTVAIAAPPAYETKMRSDRPQLILQGGISISLMISLLVWIFLDDRARALQAANQAIELALYDPLTSLPNRKLLEERTTQALATAKRHHAHAALLFIDLDKFKPVNDTYGHAYGDLLLKEVASRLHGCMRAADTAARLGGDEFVALLSELDGRQAAGVVAAKILDRLTEPYPIAGHVFDISASIGVAIYPDDGDDPTSLMKSADLAMYVAKDQGRANVQFASAPPANEAGPR